MTNFSFQKRTTPRVDMKPVPVLQIYNIPYFPGYKSLREISRPKFLGLKTRISSYTRRISRPPFLDDWLWKDMDAGDDTADAEEEWDPYDDVQTRLTDAETLELFKSDDEEDEFDRF